MITVPSGSDLEVGSPGLAVAAAVDAAPAPQALGREPPIELDGTQRWIDSVAIRAIHVAPARRTGAVSGGQRDSVVEEEDRRPAVGPGQRHAPVAKLGQASDPQRRAAMVAHDLLVRVDDAAAVASEQAAGAHRAQAPPRVHSIAARHHIIMSARDFDASRRRHHRPMR
jgi:hypothetical protein